MCVMTTLELANTKLTAKVGYGIAPQLRALSAQTRIHKDLCIRAVMSQGCNMMKYHYTLLTTDEESWLVFFHQLFSGRAKRYYLNCSVEYDNGKTAYIIRPTIKLINGMMEEGHPVLIRGDETNIIPTMKRFIMELGKFCLTTCGVIEALTIATYPGLTKDKVREHLGLVFPHGKITLNSNNRFEIDLSRSEE